MRPASHARQRGVALYVVLVLMLVLAWFAISVSRISGQQLQLVGNSQAEHQAIVSAQRAIDSTISSSEFSKEPAAVASVAIQTDVDGDGTPDFTAKLTPQPSCIRVRPIKTMELDVSKAGDRACLQSSGASGNLIAIPGVPVGAGDSLCAASEWDVAAAASDTITKTSVTVHQGVTVRLVASDAKNYCK
jgi:Tfp pilus assembly protein PilV